MEPILSVRDLVLRKGDSPVSFDVGEGLTLLLSEREAGTTSLCMALAGRFRPHSGEVSANGKTQARSRFKQVALAGTTLLDTLERQVATREVLREQVAWAQPFFSFVPKDIVHHKKVEPWLEPLGLTGLDASTDVGDLSVADRYRLRVMLALIARPDAPVVIVDDIDQLRAADLRDEILADLKRLSQRIAVLVTTVNEDPKNYADTIIDLRSSAEDIGSTLWKPEAAHPDKTETTAKTDKAGKAGNSAQPSKADEPEEA